MPDPAQTRFPEPRPERKPLLRTTLGAALRRARLAQRRTLADVARAARVSMPYLSELERGRKEASSEVIAAVCEALHLELPELLAEVGRDLLAGQLQPRQASLARLDLARARASDLRNGAVGGTQCLLAA